LLAVFLYIRYFAETQYEIKSAILVKDENAGQGSLETASIKSLGLIKSSHNIEDQIGILKSPGLMEKVVSKRSLNINYYVEGNVRDVEIYGDETPVDVLVDETTSNVVYDQPIYIALLENDRYELRTSYNNTEYKKEYAFGDVISEPFGTFTVTRRLNSTYKSGRRPMYFVIRKTDEVIDKFLKNLSVELVNDAGGLLDLRFLSVTKKKGEAVLATLIETYVEEMIKYENELAENTIKMIDDRVKLLSGEISGVEKSVEEFKTQNDLTDVGSNANIYIEQANDYQNMIIDYQSQINVIQSIESYMMEGNTDSPIPGALSTSDPSLISSIDRYNATLMEKKQLSQSASSSNPLIVKLNKTLEDLRNAILENVRSAKSRLTIAQRNLQSNANKYQAQIAKVPAMERKLLDISRQQSTKEGLYLYLLQKREEEVLSMAAPVSSTRIVSLPKAGRWPVSPNKATLYLGGLLLGLFLPFSLIYAKDILNNKVTSVNQLSSLTSAPVLGEIARSGDNNIIVTTEKNRTPTAELFRLLRFNLEYLKKTESNKTLLVTSTVKGEGKTFIATNLGVSLATAGEKVIILSFDLRRPRLLQNLKISDTPGITDFILNQEMSVNQLIKAHPTIANLFFVGSGTEVPQVGNLMLSARIATMMEVLQNNFDRIIIDSAPIGSVSDAFALNSYIDSTIYVARQDVTKKDHLQTLTNIHQNGKLKNTMVLFNDTVSKETYGYGVDEEEPDLRAVLKRYWLKSKAIAQKTKGAVLPLWKKLRYKMKKRD
ncbi:MAG TPA: polysaccharide biosynthesis tyrosine autokinase, partial [Pricia sp.]|nr:polysaccharide biosynthesis tyrosine autokinase [Pricia sp.]